MTDVSEQSVAEVLNLAADLIEPEGCWSRQLLAKNAEGCSVSPRDPGAVCWCAMGAIFKLTPGGTNERYGATNALQSVVGGSILSFNDAPERTQAEVVAALRSAALLAAPRAGEGVERG